jgi:hypothetical protein
MVGDSRPSYVNFRGNNDPEIENPPEGRALKKKTKTAKAMT